MHSVVSLILDIPPKVHVFYKIGSGPLLRRDFVGDFYIIEIVFKDYYKG